MADNNVNLNIKTKADASGANEIEERLKALKAKTDALVDSQEKLGESTKDQGDSPTPMGGGDTQIKDQMSQMLRIQYASMARDIGQGISSIAKALHDTAQASAVADPALSATLKNTATGLDSLSLGLTGAAQGFAVGGPLGGAIGGLVGLMAGPLKTAFNDYQESLIKAGEAEKAAAEAVKKYKLARTAFAELLKSQNVEDYYNKELAAIDATTAAIQRRAKVEAAQRSAATATREASQTEANRDPKRSLADRAVADVSGDFADQKAALEAEIKAAMDAAAQMEAKASKLFFEAQSIAAADSSVSQSAARAAEDAATKAQAAADGAQADADATIEIAKAKLSALMEGFGTRLGDATEEVQEKAADDAKKIVEKIKASGAELDSTQQLAIQNYEKIVEDGKVTAAEQVGLQQALVALIGNWKTDTQTMLKTLAEANQVSTTLTSGLATIAREIETQKQTLKSITLLRQ